jgi:hypothetical protein
MREPGLSISAGGRNAQVGPAMDLTTFSKPASFDILTSPSRQWTRSIPQLSQYWLANQNRASHHFFGSILLVFEDGGDIASFV